MKISFAYLNRIRQYGKELGHTPEADWRLLFWTFCLVAVGLLAFSGFILYQVNAGEIFRAEKKDTAALRTIDRAKLKALVEEQQVRERTFSTLKNGERPVLVDPGL